MAPWEETKWEEQGGWDQNQNDAQSWDQGKDQAWGGAAKQSWGKDSQPDNKQADKGWGDDKQPKSWDAKPAWDQKPTWNAAPQAKSWDAKPAWEEKKAGLNNTMFSGLILSVICLAKIRCTGLILSVVTSK